MLDLERKAIEPMARALEGGDVQAMQQYISVGAWQDEPIILKHQAWVAATLGAPDGVVILDGCDFPKQGDDSVGVARQWCGPLGKVANCQAGVVLVHASSKGFTMIDRRLYLPQEWFDDDHRDRWKKCGIPEDTPFQTKPQLGWTMLEPLIRRRVLPFQWVTMQEGTKGLLVADIAAIRVTVVEDGLPGREEWFVFRRSLGRKPVLKTYRCNAPADTPWKRWRA